MRVDGVGLLLDLSGMQNSAVDPASLTDPTVKRVEWGQIVHRGSVKECGRIFKQDDGVETFWSPQVLAPYLAAFKARLAELTEQQEKASNGPA
jgi:hypothetical protein